MNFLPFFQQFHPIAPADYQMFLDACTNRRYERGAVITAEGEIQRDLLLVLRGVQMSFAEHGNRLHVMAFTYPPGFSGIPDSFLTQTPSRFTLQALTDTETLNIPFTTLNDLFDRSAAMERLFRKMTEAVLVGMIQRHFELQSLSIEERFLAFARRSPHLLQLVPHKYLASYLNINSKYQSHQFQQAVQRCESVAGNPALPPEGSTRDVGLYQHLHCPAYVGLCCGN